MSNNETFGINLAKEILKQRGQFNFTNATDKEQDFCLGMIKNHMAQWKKGPDLGGFYDWLVKPNEKMWKLLNHLGEI